jgi:diaminohydroxyphosphoribosylaminopyrimidine deaminase/5-amino-6-(5-phosphoribosylamino)uracil reductase
MNMTVPDSVHLNRALELAALGVGLASPNPCVGAVVVDAQGQVAGEGTHRYAEVAHAETIALQAAGTRARGATLYINLEPCSHQGRTGPCVEALIQAGVQRVVAAMPDPNPVVAGRGFARLRSAGIEVEVADGVLRQSAQHLNEAFAKYIQHGTPLVTLKAGLTLDGRMAPAPGHRRPEGAPSGGTPITSEASCAHVQQMRHASDAILVGVGTVLADDPLLTDRTGEPRRRPLLRVVFDSRLRLPLDSRLVRSAQDDVLVFCAFAEEKRRRELESRGIRVEQLPLYAGDYALVVGGPPIRTADGRPDMRALVKRLGEMEITSLLIEGGALVNWAALAAGVVDKVFLFYAPRIMGGEGAVPFAGGEGFRDMGEAAHVQRYTLHRFGEDFAVEGYLKDPYGMSLVPGTRGEDGGAEASE